MKIGGAYSIPSGDSLFRFAQIAPIYDGFLLEKGVRLLNLGGKDVTRQLAALVNAQVGPS